MRQSRDSGDDFWSKFLHIFLKDFRLNRDPICHFTNLRDISSDDFYHFQDVLYGQLWFQNGMLDCFKDTFTHLRWKILSKSNISMLSGRNFFENQ